MLSFYQGTSLLNYISIGKKISSSLFFFFFFVVAQKEVGKIFCGSDLFYPPGNQSTEVLKLGA